MDTTDAFAMARGLMNAHGLGHWILTFDRAKRRAGICKHTKRTIALSYPLTQIRDEKSVRDTVLHEIAHALVGPGHGHDNVWKQKALSIGCNGERCFDDARVEFTFIGRCPNGHTMGRHRRPSKAASCVKCNPTFDARYLITWARA